MRNDERAGAEIDFGDVVDALPGLVWTTYADGQCDFANRRWREYTDLAADKALGHGWRAAIHPNDLEPFLESWEHIRRSGDAKEIDARLRRFDGQYRWFVLRPTPISDHLNHVGRWCWFGSDADESSTAGGRLRRLFDTMPIRAGLKRAEALLAAEVKLLERVARGEPLAQFLDAFTRHVEELCDGSFCGVLVVSPDGRTVHVGAGPHLPRIFHDLLEGRAVDGHDPYSLSILEKVPVVTADLAGDPRWEDSSWLPVMDGLGFGSCCAMPIVSASGEVSGVVAIHRREPVAAMVREEELIDRLAKIAGIAIDKARADEALRASEAELSVEKHLLEMTASGRPLDEVLDAVCRFVEEVSPECLCGIYPIDWSGPAFKYGVAPSLPASYIDPIRGWPVAVDKAPCGIAVAEDRQVIVEDVETDPTWRGTEYRDHVVSHGLRSVWSTLIRSQDGGVLGSFCIYQRAPATPTPRHQQLISHATHIASIALDRAGADAALLARERELRRTNMQLTDAHRLSRTGSFTWDVEADEHTWTEEIFRLFEFDPAGKVGMEMLLATIHPDDLPEVETLLGRAMEGADFDLGFRIVPRSGLVKHARVVGRRVEQITDRLVFMGALQDVTASKTAEEALNRARSDLAHVARAATLSALTASIAHEVNQPLSGILTNANTCLRMLAADPPNLAGAGETARRTIRDANRAAEVIKRLRAMFAKSAPANEMVDLNDATRELITLSSSELQRSRVVLQTQFTEDLPPISGDRIQLQQVILNLLLNAADAMTGVEDRPRTLLVRTELHDDDSVRLLVRDCGVGLDPHAIDRLFDPFYTTKAEGMGIGLAISRSIIESHEGRLWATPNKGPGATFSFCVPGAATGAPAGHA